MQLAKALIIKHLFEWLGHKSSIPSQHIAQQHHHLKYSEIPKNYTIIILKSSNSELGRKEHIKIVERGRVCIYNLQLDSQLTTSTKYSNTCILNMPPKL